MGFSKSAVSALLLAGSAAAFAPAAKLPAAFVTTNTVARTSGGGIVSSTAHAPGCACVACSARPHPSTCTCASCNTLRSGCTCSLCRRGVSVLFSTTTTKEDEEAAILTPDVPAEVEALDGVYNEDEAHNAERPARKSLKKKVPQGKPLSEFKVGDSVKATVRTITTYGAFVDFGATSDGLLHISQLTLGFVADVNAILRVGQELDVRITSIDETKNQVGLSLLTKAEETQAKENAQRSRQPRERPQSVGPPRRNDAPVLAQLVAKGWNSDQFVEGTVLSTVDFGAFVRIKASQLNEEVEGDFDGLLHISALSSGRVNSVSSVVSVNDKIQVRVKAISDQKVALSMLSAQNEAAKSESTPGAQAVAQGEGAKDWKDSLTKVQSSMTEFKNRPMVVNLRK